MSEAEAVVDANPQDQSASATVDDDPFSDAKEAFGSMFLSEKRNESNKLFKELDKDRNDGASSEEIAQFVASNDKLWMLLSVNLDQPPEVAAKIATRVAMELATGLTGEEAMAAVLSKDQFHTFRKKYILDPAGSQEFFFRAVFASFDTDNNNVLDTKELDQFLDIFYKSGSAFQGAMGTIKLPPKDKLHDIFLKEFDDNGDQELSFDEVRMIISGQIRAEMAEEIEAQALEAERLEKERVEKERLEKESRRKEKEEEERKKKEAKLQGSKTQSKSSSSVATSSSSTQDGTEGAVESTNKDEDDGCALCEWVAGLFGAAPAAKA
ncbi:expressed unknown protein [Seminavis robusta]|uniref:EF-hand domain-containing protein n=1 Tax=Seminavis robusta TaxID=568900 RepID=A0A9N8EDX2_9STRA|nr:expressed unknown protein [Seminavis robusta]|eukprot:Sro1035_g233960.1 n/a (324) ;mRNA; r:35211-36182